MLSLYFICSQIVLSGLLMIYCVLWSCFSPFRFFRCLVSWKKNGVIAYISPSVACSPKSREVA